MSEIDMNQLRQHERVGQQVAELQAEVAKWKRIRTPGHGPCCTCQACGLPHDECRCDLDDVADDMVQAREKADRLQTIVDKLPKCWRLEENGMLVRDVPITPGMTVYDIYGYRGITKRVADGVWCREGRWLLRTDNITFFPPEDCGDTREAAEALLNQEQPENTERKS